MTTSFDRELESRLVRYAAIDTQSDETSASSPSTGSQLVLLQLLVEELIEIGASDVQLTEYGAVLAPIPSTVEHPIPVIGLLAHVDTAPDYSAVDVKPVVHRNYNGGVITFADAPELSLSPDRSPYLATKLGDDIITASGKTLLGADDKSGIAIIMSAACHFLTHPEIRHGAIRIAFTPDEEIGRGINEELAKELGAAFAFTLDGPECGVIEYESFSADGATIQITGVSTHPGTAKGKLVNALHLCAKIIGALPQSTMTPETTEGRQGFIHVYELNGSAGEAEMKLILRDFELDGLIPTLVDYDPSDGPDRLAGEARCAARSQRRCFAVAFSWQVGNIRLALHRASSATTSGKPIWRTEGRVFALFGCRRTPWPMPRIDLRSAPGRTGRKPGQMSHSQRGLVLPHWAIWCDRCATQSRRPNRGPKSSAQSDLNTETCAIGWKKI